MELVNQSQIVIARIRWSKIYANWYYILENTLEKILKNKNLEPGSSVQVKDLTIFPKTDRSGSIKVDRNKNTFSVFITDGKAVEHNLSR